MADIERALGRPERALELSPRTRRRASWAGPRASSSPSSPPAPGATSASSTPPSSACRSPSWTRRAGSRGAPRLFYAYADNLLAAGRESEALQWFVHAADADDDGETDADRRIAELTGEPLPDDDFAFDTEDEPSARPNDADAAPSGPDDSGAASPGAAGSTADGMEPSDRDVSGAADSGVADSGVADSEVADSRSPTRGRGDGVHRCRVRRRRASEPWRRVHRASAAPSPPAPSPSAPSPPVPSPSAPSPPAPSQGRRARRRRVGAESVGADTADVDAVGGQVHAAEAAGSTAEPDSTAPDSTTPDPAHPDDPSGPGQPDRGAAEEREPGVAG